jgi:membrane protease YdiL (CAAX protease family)
MRIPRNSVISLLVFLALLTICTAVGYWLLFRLGRATPIMLAVGAATILTCLARKQNLTTLGWGWGDWKHQWLSYLLPLLITGVAYGIIWSAGLGGWFDQDYVREQSQAYNLGDWSTGGIIVFHFLLTASYSFVISLPAALGEEMGWRGFLVPELAKSMSFTGVALVSGFIWAAWHLPLFLMGFYGVDGTPLYYQLFFFFLLLMSNSVTMTYLRLKTGSLWTAVIFHASGNVFMQKFFAPLTLANEKTTWFADEFGAIPALLALAVALWFWRKGKTEFGAQSVSSMAAR